MTKEEFFSKVMDANSRTITLELFNEFFSEHVVISKGTNRHPYANVLHEWAEGIEVQHSFDGVTWLDTDKTAFVIRRIKPSEPVYEWQWYYVTPDRTIRIEENFMTEEECGKAPWIKFEETKRERKATPLPKMKEA